MDFLSLSGIIIFCAILLVAVIRYWIDLLLFIIPFIYLGFICIVWPLENYYFGFPNSYLLFIPLLIHFSALFVNRKNYCFTNFGIYMFLISTFTAYMFISCLWSRNPEYGFYKAGLFSISVLGPSTILITAKARRDSLRFFTLAIQLLCILLSVELYFFGEPAGGGRLTLPNGNPIWLSRIGILAIIASLWNLSNFKGLYGIIFNGTILFFASWVILLTGSRGPVLAFIIAVILTYALILIFKRTQSKVTTYIALLSVSLITIFIPLLLMHLFPQATDRYIELFTSQNVGATDVNIGQRLMFVPDAIKLFQDKPIFGGGTGSFSLVAREYPHNIVLEILCELGLVGFLIFLLILLYLLKKIISSKNTSPGDLVLFLAATIFALFSGDLAGNNEWLIIGSFLLLKTSVDFPNKEQPNKAKSYG